MKKLTKTNPSYELVIKVKQFVKEEKFDEAINQIQIFREIHSGDNFDMYTDILLGQIFFTNASKQKQDIFLKEYLLNNARIHFKAALETCNKHLRMNQKLFTTINYNLQQKKLLELLGQIETEYKALN